jgi:hypothetical protein
MVLPAIQTTSASITVVSIPEFAEVWALCAIARQVVDFLWFPAGVD